MNENSQNKYAGAGELKQLAEEQRRLAEIGRIVSSSLDIADVYPRFAEHARALVRADRMVIALYSEDKTELNDEYIEGFEVPPEPSASLERPINKDSYKSLIVDQVPISYGGTDIEDHNYGSSEE